MKQLFLNVKDGSMKLIDQPMPTVKENMALVETLYTVVSAGTERGLASFGGKNLVQKALERPDQVKKVLEKLSTDGIVTTIESAFNKLAEPMPMGYSGVGRVISCGKGVTEVQAGDLVAMVGTAYHCEINRVSRTMLTKIPEELQDYRQAAFCALGGIALEGIHQAEVVPGETVAVIGMGLLGHIVSRILNAYGCDVIGYDVVDKTMPGTNLKAFINSGDDSAVDMTKALTRGRGVDKVIITAAANTNAPMDLAAAIARDRGIICMIGVTQMNIDRRPYYERELSFRIARSYGAGRYDATYEQKGIDYPIGYVRFTEGRNIEEFVRLLAQERISLSDIITHEIPFAQAAEAYEMITKNPKHERYIGVLLKYDEENKEKWNGTIHNPEAKKSVSGDKIRLGLIGAGNFVRSTMLPIMKETGLFEFRGLATTGGVGGAQANSGTPFAYTTNDYKELLADLMRQILQKDGIPIRGVYERSDAKEREKEGLSRVKGFIGDEFDTNVEIVENGVHYMVDVVNGQKTGFFLDQKYNRLAIQKLCKGKRVLDCFTHMGTFALNAGIAGAREVTGLDISEFAVEQATQNAKRNGLSETVKFRAANVLDELPKLAAAGEKYDVVILDPPAFTKSRQATKNAIKGYREINMKGLKLVKDGGYLATCSCSHFMTQELLAKTIREAARSTHKRLRQVEFRTQSADHPILWAADESYYLKFFIFQVVDEK